MLKVSNRIEPDEERERMVNNRSERQAKRESSAGSHSRT
jgi:hypothetical protein